MIDEFRDLWREKEEASKKEENKKEENQKEETKDEYEGINHVKRVEDSKMDKALLAFAAKIYKYVEYVRDFVFDILVKLNIADPDDKEFKDKLAVSMVSFGSIIIALIMQVVVLTRASKNPKAKKDTEADKSNKGSPTNNEKAPKKKSKKIN